MNNWGQQPNGQPYNGHNHNYQPMPPQHGYHQLPPPPQQQHHHQQQHQQYGNGNGNAMPFMGNQQYQAPSQFMHLPNPQMQQMPQYAHVQPPNNFHAPHHQHYNNAAYTQHAPVPQAQYMPHASYPQQVATPSPRPVQQHLPPQPMSHPHHIAQKPRPPPQTQPLHLNSPHMASNQLHATQQAQPMRVNSPHVAPNQLHAIPQQQPSRINSPHMAPKQRHANAQPQPLRVNSPHMAPNQLHASPQTQPLRVNSPHVAPNQLHAMPQTQSPQMNSQHIAPNQLHAIPQTQSPQTNSPHTVSHQLHATPQPPPSRMESPHIAPNQLHAIPQAQSSQMNSQHIAPNQLHAMPQTQSPQMNSPHAAPNQLHAPPQSQASRMNSPHVPPTQLQSAVQSPRVQEVKHQSPPAQTQRHVSDSIDPTKLMMKAQAPARKSMPASGITKSPSMSTRSPSLPHAQTPSSHFDTPAVLICVADDCFQTAHSAVQNVAASLDQANMDEYYKLIATGLGCLDAALSLNKLPARTEANIRLRYATILSEETDNLMEAETALTKGIAVCEKNRFLDLKYCMQFQLLKVLFRRNRKAAFIAVDKNIQDAMTYKAVDWVYAFRFLRASFHLQTGNPADAQALENLRSIAGIANPRGDHVVAVLTALLEGIMHLKSRKDDSIVRVQTCIAQASRYQLDPSVHIPQIDVLTLLLDLACSLQQKAPLVAMQKLKALQVRMDELVQAHEWDKCLDQLLVPLKRQPNSSALVSDDTKAIIQPGPGEYNFIVLSFVTKVHAFVLAYVLSGLALLYQGSKSEKVMEYWTEALNMLAKSPQQVRPPAYSLPMAIEQAKWRAEVACYIYTLIALISATRTQWTRVRDCLDRIEALNPKPEDGRLGLLVLYVTGIYHQGTGDLDAALKVFNDQRFAIPDADTISGNAAATPPSEVALLATLNRIWIMQDPAYRDDYQVSELVDRIKPYCSDHADTDIRTAFSLAQAAIQTEPRQSIQTVKRHIQAGLKWAQNANNTHLLSISLNLMRAMLFENVVGDQAVKSAKAGRAQANKAGNMLWMSVGDGMLAQTEEMQGQVEQAERLRQSGTQLANQAFMKQ